MPHIHTKPGQHDMTTSAYIFLREDNEWKCLVHFHKKIEKLMQIGGHIELDETPWQAMAHELAEESGYRLSELDVLQHTSDRAQEAGNLAHPTPVLMNTHHTGSAHFHSDMCFGFIAKSRPSHQVEDGESADLRWLVISELEDLAEAGIALRDVAYMYHFLLDHLETYVHVPAINFSTDKPADIGVTYVRGGANESH